MDASMYGNDAIDATMSGNNVIDATMSVNNVIDATMSVNNVIDATMSGNQAKFVNHSCDPNLIAAGKWKLHEMPRKLNYCWIHRHHHFEFH
ncbi:Protein CBG22781 [Caenorhabditis briggsae]|uniref:Protein CBG22781 n=2 Tax=Caenorhabditis briggsae TaxID=6238 RepID=A8Y2V7_CAEBR|nr:Protein CBG22781 [Caenorhabditis briggsae]ULT84026.1 hypothetical protein L3Y34_012981 [Caenorhabditis briggsae]CAP39291.1 Protein CBG22781 [Caenorhabditis briggsae]